MAVDRHFEERSEEHIRAARLARIAEEGRAALERANAWLAAPAGTPYPVPTQPKQKSRRRSRKISS